VKLAVELSSLIGTFPPASITKDGPPLLENLTFLSNIVLPYKKGPNNSILSTFDLKRLDCMAFLSRGQTCLKAFIENTLDNIERAKVSLDEIKGEFTEEDVKHLLMLHHFQIPQLSITLHGRFIPTGIGAIGEKVKLVIEAEFEAAHLEETMMFNAVRLLEDIPLNVFHRCPECRKWFAHFSERKKQFCSNRCAARHGVRKSRAELKSNNAEKYEEELRSGAERAHKSYAAKITHGKPARRPYKHK